jgi:hypothetical protein
LRPIIRRAPVRPATPRNHQAVPAVTGHVDAEEPIQPAVASADGAETQAADEPAAAAAAVEAPTARTSRVLVIAFVLCLAFIGWLAISGIDGAAAFAHGLLDAGPGGCGGG